MNLQSKETEQSRKSLVWWNDNSQPRSCSFSQDGSRTWRSMKGQNASDDRPWRKTSRKMSITTKIALIIGAIIVFLLVSIFLFCWSGGYPG